MTRKGVEKLVDGMIETVRVARGLKPGPIAKGGEIEVANGAVYGAIKDLLPAILAKAGVPPVKETVSLPVSDAPETEDGHEAA